MKLETFFNRFDELADTPNAVGKMRELILQLAAHGKLVEQSSDDEPASALISQIEKHIEGLRSRREFRGSPVEPMDRDQLPEIPPSWEWVRLGNVVDYGSSEKAESSEIPEDAWLLDLEDIEKDTSRLLQRKSFRDSPSKSTKTAFAFGDVLYGKLRPYLNKVIVADSPGYCTTEIIPIRAFGFIDPVYLCHALKRPEFIAYANSKSYGMNLPRLGTEDARSAPFPLPPLAEQKRIVAKVDELMALCDRLEAQQQEREVRHAALARASLARFANAPTPANLHLLFHPSFSIQPSDLRKSILTLAVQGKLVPQDPNDEPVEHSLLKLGPLAVQSDNDGSPTHWLRVPLGKLGEWRGGGTPSKSRPEFWGGDLPWVSPKDMKVLHVIDAQDHISPAALEGSSVRLIPPGSILMVVRGMILARAFPVAVAMREICINQDMKALLPSEPKTQEYLLVALRAFEPEILAAIEHSSHGTCKLKTEVLQDFVIPIPPLAEQRRIVAKVEQLMGMVDALEAQLAASRATAANLLSALVAELTSPQPVLGLGLSEGSLSPTRP